VKYLPGLAKRFDSAPGNMPDDPMSDAYWLREQDKRVAELDAEVERLREELDNARDEVVLRDLTIARLEGAITQMADRGHYA
jgi:hypothetical protein